MFYPKIIAMKMIYGLLFIATWLVATEMSGQRTVDIKLHETIHSSDRGCYQIQLRSPNGKDIDLAGQNYRIFYDASKLQFDRESVRTRLNSEAYTPIEIINTTSNNIGFVSLSIDGRELNQQVEKLSREGTWHSTADICFKVLSDKSYELTWAHPDRTAHFASATVAMSEWVTPYEQQILEPNELFDYTSQLRLPDLEEGGYNVRFFPNPVVDFVNVEVPSSTDKSSRIIIKDVIGREVVFDQLAGRSTMMYDLTNWPEGIYRLEVLNAEGNLLFSDQLIKARP